MQVLDHSAESYPFYEALEFDIHHVLTKTIKFEADDLGECLGLINLDDVHPFVYLGQNLLG